MDKQQLIIRFEIIKEIRAFFHQEGFTEVDTPLLGSSPGIEPYLEPFRTTLITPDKKKRICCLPYSPEFFMKRLLAKGFDKIFQIAHCFRNEELSDYHLPEFLMLEWYRTNADYTALMKDSENLVSYLCSKRNISSILWNKRNIDLSPPWNRISVNELFKKHLAIDLNECKDASIFFLKLKQKGLPLDKHYANDWNASFFSAFLNAIEPHIDSDKPLFVLDYPTCISALAKEKPHDTFYAERFELYIGGLELANGCTELQNYTEHRKRFNKCNAERKIMHKKPYPFDKEFFSAIKNGLPASAGVALGVDRLLKGSRL